MCVVNLLYGESERVSFVLVLSLASAKEGKYMLCIHKQALPFFNLKFVFLSWHHVNKISIID